MAARQSRRQRVDGGDGRAGSARHHLRRAAHSRVRGGTVHVIPRKARADRTTRPNHAADVDADRDRGGVHGHVELAAPLFHPGTLASDVQRAHDSLCIRAGAADAGIRSPPDRGDRHWHIVGWRGAVGGAVADAAQRRLQVSP